LIGGSLLGLVAGSGAADLRLPALPLPPQAQAGATNAIRLHNRELEVLVFPDAGRIGQIGFGAHHNLLRLDADLQADARKPADGWKNFGGDWLWPVLQSRWPALGGGDWPPPAVLETRPWQATSWVDVQGDHCCLLTNYYGPPVNLAASRLIRLDAAQSRLTIEQRLTRTAPSDIPATLWHISQVAGAEDAAMAGSNHVVLGFTPPPADLLSVCASATVLRVAHGTEHKVGSAAAEGWVAARRTEWLLVASARGSEEQGAWPDKGCRVELYSNRGLGYTEIETLSDERALKPGESMSNTLTLEAFHLPRPLTGCALADWIRSHGLRARNP
jgi:hypothetical protein